MPLEEARRAPMKPSAPAEPSRPPVTHVIDGTTFHIRGGARGSAFDDLYHAFLTASWGRALLAVVAVYLALNALFAAAFMAAGGIANSDGSFLESFSFSVQTMGTIGYGYFYPASAPAQLLVDAESVVGLLVTALATGLVFAKFGRTAAKVVFARNATISRHDGVPTLFVRVGNTRTSPIVDVRFEVVFTRAERSREGTHFYRSYDLPLARDHASGLRSAFTLLHAIGPASPLHGYDAARFVAEEAEIVVTVSGVDAVTLQPVYARYTYDERTLRFGARPADVVTPRADGSIDLDLDRFHDVAEVAGE